MIEPFLKLLWHIEISITFHKAYNPYCLVGTRNYAQCEKHREILPIRQNPYRALSDTHSAVKDCLGFLVYITKTFRLFIVSKRVCVLCSKDR